MLSAILWRPRDIWLYPNRPISPPPLSRRVSRPRKRRRARKIRVPKVPWNLNYGILSEISNLLLPCFTLSLIICIRISSSLCQSIYQLPRFGVMTRGVWILCRGLRIAMHKHRASNPRAVRPIPEPRKHTRTFSMKVWVNHDWRLRRVVGLSAMSKSLYACYHMTVIAPEIQISLPSVKSTYSRDTLQLWFGAEEVLAVPEICAFLKWRYAVQI